MTCPKSDSQSLEVWAQALALLQELQASLGTLRNGLQIAKANGLISAVWEMARIFLLVGLFLCLVSQGVGGHKRGCPVAIPSKQGKAPAGSEWDRPCIIQGSS